MGASRGRAPGGSPPRHPARARRRTPPARRGTPGRPARSANRGSRRPGSRRAAGVGRVAVGGVAGRHRDAVDALGPERLDREGRRERGVDPARDADDEAARSRTSHVVAQAEDECAAHLLEVVGEGREPAASGASTRRRAASPRSRERARAPRRRARSECPSKRARPGRRPVSEHEAHAVLACARRRRWPRDRGSADVERRGGEVDDELGTRGDEIGRRRPGEPHVLADRDPDRRARDVDERRARHRKRSSASRRRRRSSAGATSSPSRRPRRRRRRRTAL